ncbi:hypothetical protein HBI25_198180 [Parastagonospora nodorum]|nr:hypothetical protein HBH95_196310 [Parastagonospora nodorum]KAH5105680.1 hypothetical protein HBH71_201130 [Parastagonospora nodorum]KAH5147655.1 hypothetical protein HBH69_168050 [Parastagonospora nodorum]KAH5241860.1 hypothetical protein HBI71_205940 [Parastagonospora nodorum]KAH5256925.1 hypothetical protein HBI70_181320 [Parastagonospora nodorum]
MQSTKPDKTSAPYGQACVHCVKAKSRCMLRTGGSCERCHRLNKECVPSATLRRRSAKQAKVSKRNQLEDKLDDLVTLIRTQQVAQASERSVDQQVITPSSLDFSPQQTGYTTPCDGGLTESDLHAFREFHLPYFPMIYLPPSMSARELQREKPMLALAIEIVMNKASKQQVQLSERFRTKMAMKLFVDGEKSLDLLLSLLVCMAWSVYFTSGKKFLVMFSATSRSLVSDLRVDRTRFPSWCPSIAPGCEEGIEQSNESRRTLLACYAMTAIISLTFNSDIIAWSPQLEENCAKLAQARETEGDEILIAIVFISRICLQATEVHRYLADNNGGHVSMHIKPLKDKLELFKATLSDEQRSHTTINAYLCAAAIAIHELAIFHPPTVATPFNSALDHKRIGYLTNCLQACQDYTESYLNSDMIYVTTASGLLFSYCLKTLHKLSTLQDFMWDTTIAKQTVDVVGLLERCAGSAEESNARLKEQTGEDSVYLKAARTLREMAPNWRVAVAHEPSSNGDATAVETWPAVDHMDLSLLDFSGDFWLNAPFDV